MIIRSLLTSVFMGISLLGAADALQVEEVSLEQKNLLEFLDKSQYIFLMNTKSNVLPENKEERNVKVNEILSERSEDLKKGISKLLYVSDKSAIDVVPVCSISFYPSFLVKEDQKTSVIVNVGLVPLTQNPELLFKGVKALAGYGYELYPDLPYLSYTPKDYSGFSKFLTEEKYVPENFEGYTLEPVNFFASYGEPLFQWHERKPK